jgi:hypothetical protein
VSGKRWFYSLGQRSIRADYIGPWPQIAWPEWARLSFFRGQDDARWAVRAVKEAGDADA